LRLVAAHAFDAALARPPQAFEVIAPCAAALAGEVITAAA